jgi:predicted Rossmann fold flavoprotein
MLEEPNEFDLLVIGAGAAGLMTAITAGRSAPHLRVAILDGSRRLGSKLLISGGGRCNVTNHNVRVSDFNGGSGRLVGRVLDSLPVPATIEFFRQLGVALHVEADGKYFPDTNRAASVLDALLRALREAGVGLLARHRVEAVTRRDEGFVVESGGGRFQAARVVIATGGLSVPQTGSDGAGYAFAKGLGHTIVPTTPALVPLLLAGGMHGRLAGVTERVRVRLREDGRRIHATEGSLLWTHVGISGPAALDASRHWHRAQLEERDVRVSLALVPSERFETLDGAFLEAAQRQPRSTPLTVLSRHMPAAVVREILSALGVDATTPLAHLEREARRRIVHAVLDWPVHVTGSRGYQVAEVTAGGVALDEVDAATLESRRCRGLFFAGEILDVDGRLGGFNFQWAWASGFVAGRAASSIRSAESGMRN